MGQGSGLPFHLVREVDRARDSRLKRDVAVKVLLEGVSADPDRLARFQREAEALAALNHPNIAAIYGLEGTAVVLELVEGPTLADLGFEPGIPIALFDTHTAGYLPHDVSPEGRFLINTPVSATGESAKPIAVVLNWTASLKK
ncbi:MAG TPA: hypothetical protein VGH38_28205 [Bryobacteraceae bacterium]